MIYGKFADVYDLLMSDVDYTRWVDYLQKIFAKYKAEPKLVLEIGCGTGNVTIEAAKRGYEMIGLDLSPDMLSAAQEKALDHGQDILFLNQDMTDFELYGTVDAIVCFMDGVNYITRTKSLEKMFRLVYNYLNPGGLFVFDIRSEYALSNIVGNNTFAEDREEVSYIWQNEFDNKNKISNMKVTFFVKEDDSYTKFTEVHKLKCYSEDDILSLLQKSGFRDIRTFDNLRLQKLSDKSERIFFAAKK